MLKILKDFNNKKDLKNILKLIDSAELEISFLGITLLKTAPYYKNIKNLATFYYIGTLDNNLQITKYLYNCYKSIKNISVLNLYYSFSHEIYYTLLNKIRVKFKYKDYCSSDKLICTLNKIISIKNLIALNVIPLNLSIGDIIFNSINNNSFYRKNKNYFIKIENIREKLPILKKQVLFYHYYSPNLNYLGNGTSLKILINLIKKEFITKKVCFSEHDKIFNLLVRYIINYKDEFRNY